MRFAIAAAQLMGTAIAVTQSSVVKSYKPVLLGDLATKTYNHWFTWREEKPSRILFYEQWVYDLAEVDWSSITADADRNYKVVWWRCDNEPWPQQESHTVCKYYQAQC